MNRQRNKLSAEKIRNNREAISIIADNVQGLDRPREDEGRGNSPGKPDSSAKADDFDPFLED